MSQIPKASKEVQLAWIRHRTFCRFIDGGWSTARTLLRTGAWVGVVYFVFEAVRMFAGKETKVSAVIDAAVRMSLDRWLAYLLAAAFGITWSIERRNRRRVIAENGKYIRKLEERIDPDRTSSNLMPDGRTRKRDRDAL